MTVLSKDMLQIVTRRDYLNTGGWNGTSTLLEVTTETVGGIDGGIPVVENYPLTQDELNVGIRLLTQDEYNALREYLVGSMNEPEASTEFLQNLYSNPLGRPLWVVGYLAYYGAWYDYYFGVGFYKFTGYNPSDPPLQTIEVESIRRIY